jgi:Bucentaur or craniofacial development
MATNKDTIPEAGEADLSQRKDRVDEAFQDLYGFPWGTTFHLQSKSTNPSRISDATTQILVEMLGRTSAARILRYTDRVVSGNAVPTRRHTQPMLPPLTSSQNAPKNCTLSKKPAVHKKEQHAKHRLAVQGLHPEKLISTTTSVVPPVTVSAVVLPKSNNPAVGMDQLLQQLQDTGKVSTIAKTSSDWDQFKEQSGLGERLKEQAESNTSYLQKQDFLTRVDHRTFEVERKEREQNRAKRDK